MKTAEELYNELKRDYPRIHAKYCPQIASGTLLDIVREAREGMVEEHEMRPIVGRLCDCYATLENLRAKHPNLFTK